METTPFFPTNTDEKTLRASFVRDEDERPKVAYDEFSDDIPIISLAGIDDDADGRKRAEIRKKMAKACEEWGIFQVIDHGIHAQLVEDMKRLSKDFFVLPTEEKMKFDMSGGKRGGFLVSSHLEGEPVQDWREFVVFFSQPARSRDYSRWPDKPEGWSPVVKRYSDEVLKLACKILGVLSEAMSLDTEALNKACVEMNQIMLVNIYPKCPQPDLTLGLKHHTDVGNVTVLLQDEVGGLQATKDDGKSWITVRPVEGAFVVNLGDHGHYVSNGRFKSAGHRVVVNSNYSRLSIAAFQMPSPDAMVYPLAIREGEKPIMDEPISFAKMHETKMKRDVEASKLKKMAKESHALKS